MRKPINSTALESYEEERALLSEEKITEILHSGKQWSLAPLLQKGGTAFFPHTYLSECGHQVAAIVQGCLDTGADQVLALGVLHPLREDLCAAKDKEQNKEDLSNEATRCIASLDNEHKYLLDNEYCLDNFEFLFQEEVKRRGIWPPKLFLRYPSIVAQDPASLPGIEELQSLVKDSVVVATSDFCHHGVAYGGAVDTPYGLNDRGRQYAQEAIEKGFTLLKQGNYEAYYKHCLATKSDSVDVATVMHYLLGGFSGKILDLRLVNTANLFEGHPAPSWVAATLAVCSV